jgi:hypothetical protein
MQDLDRRSMPVCWSCHEVTFTDSLQAASGDAPALPGSARWKRAVSVGHNRVLFLSSQLPVRKLRCDSPSPYVATRQRAIALCACVSTNALTASYDAGFVPKHLKLMTLELRVPLICFLLAQVNAAFLVVLVSAQSVKPSSRRPSGGDRSAI